MIGKTMKRRRASKVRKFVSWDLRVLLATAFIIVAIPAALGSFGTITVKDAGGTTRTYDVILDGSGNFVGMFGVCDGTAAAQCAAVKAASTAPATTDPALVVSSADGNIVALGARADSAYTSGSGSVIALLKGLYTSSTAPIPSQVPTVSIGGVGIIDSAGTNKATVKAASTPAVVGDPALVVDQRPNGCTPGHALSAASNNSTNVKASPGTLCEFTVINTTASLGVLRLYDTSSAPTCSSATGVVANYPVQANTTSPGFTINLGPFGKAFSSGIGFCFTGANADNDNTNAVTGFNLNWGYR